MLRAFGVCVLVAVFALPSAAISRGDVGTLTVSLSPDAPPVVAGSDFTLDASVSNPADSAVAVSAYTLTLTLPGGMTISPSEASCTSPAGHPETVNCGRGALAVGSTDNFSVQLSTTPDAAGTQTIQFATSDGSDSGFAPTTGSQDVTVTGQADLVPSIAAPSGTVTAGDSAGFDYTVKVHNAGPSDNVGGYTVSGSLPAGVTFASSATCSGTVGGSSFTCPGTANSGIAFNATDTYTVHVKVAASACPGGTGGSPPCDGTPSPDASVTVASNGTTDPSTPASSNTASASPATQIITQADLVPGITVAAGNHIAGDPSGFNYTVSVKNTGPSNNRGGYTVSGTFPNGISFASSPSGCTGTAGGYTCTFTPGAAGITPTTNRNFTVHVTAASSTCLGSPDTNPHACNGFADATASVASNGTTDQNPAPNDDTSVSTTINTKADIQAVSMSPSTSLLYANNAPANTETFTYQLTNAGLSDARHVSVSLPDTVASGYGADLILDSVCRVVNTGDCSSPPTGFGNNTDIGTVTAGSAVTVMIIAHANPLLGHAPPTPILSGAFNFAHTATAATFTDESSTTNNVSNNLSPNVTIDTVPSVPPNPFAIPGNGNAILTWQNSSSPGGQPIQDYLITVAPPGIALTDTQHTFTLPPVTFNANPSSACGAVAASNCYQVTVTGLANDSQTGPYTFGIQARNAVGPSDFASTTATPSANATNASVGTNTATTLTTCTTATPLLPNGTGHPVCVVYSIPSGAGGVFGADGLINVPIPAGLCGANTCIPNTGAQELGGLTGYNDRTHPLQETITWDSSLIDPKYYNHVAQCPNNSTSTTCYPNDIPIDYEDTFALLHCGLNLFNQPFCDQNNLIDHHTVPYVPATIMNPAPNLGLQAHFCAGTIASGGAGNKNYARPLPPQPALYGFGPPILSPSRQYNDPSGDACIKSMNALGSASQNGANRDIQVVLLFDSDSDGMGMRH
jgi:hypothetical protein